MKKLIFTGLILIASYSFGFTQDIIHLKTGRRIKSKVIYIKNDTIFYISSRDRRKKIKKFHKNKIKIIFFKNGNNIMRDKFAGINKVKKKQTTPDKTKKKEEWNSLLFPIQSVKKPFGIGVDIMVQDKNQSFTGVSLDYYLIKNFNIGVGYGYFFTRPAVYVNSKLIFNEIKNNWYPICDLTISILKNASEIVDKFQLKNVKNDFNIYLPSVGLEYMDKTGLTFNIKLGASFLEKPFGSINFNSMALSLRVGGHF